MTNTIANDNYDFQAPENVVLVSVDVQNDFCTGGRLAVPNGEDVVPIINQLRENFKTIVQTQDFHPTGHASFASTYEGKNVFDTVELEYGTQVLWPDHCVQGTEGADFRSDLIVKDTDLIIQKGTNAGLDSYSAFFENDGVTRPTFKEGDTFTERMQSLGIDTLVFTGLASDYCAAWNAIDASREGFMSIFVENATRMISNDTYVEQKQKMIESGVVIVQDYELKSTLQRLEMTA